MKIYCFALLFTMLILIGCAQSPQVSEQKRISPQKRISVPSNWDRQRNFPQKTQSLPSAFVPETVYKFKSVSAGTIVSHDFVIKNTGTSVLTLSRISAG
ncbi:MAG: hypothetical protein AB7S75_17315 [Desulfococcaceae bacterium]